MRTGISEAQFLRQVIQLANMRGWTVAHFRPGMDRRGNWQTAVQGDGAGFPDLVLLRGPAMVVAELKVGRNKTTPAQKDWLKKFADAGAQAFVWRPDDWRNIEEVLL